MKITSRLLLINKKPLIIFPFLTIFLVGCSDTTINKYDNLAQIDGYRNVILMIGDGMGINHLKVAEAYNQSPTFIVGEAEISGWVKTASFNSTITDSAAAATALSTGIKTRNGNIAYKDCFKLTTMSEYAHAYGMSTGIIATETLTGATPAAFSSHNRSRKNTDHIFVEQIRSNVDIFMGAGKSYYDSRVSDINDQRRPYYTNFEALQNAIDKFVSGEEKLTSFLASFDVISTSSSTASSPIIVGEILQPGFDTYQHVLGDNRLIGIGYNADENGFVTGMKISAYNVLSGEEETLQTYNIFSYDYSSGTSWSYGFSEALYNHKALLVSVERGYFGFAVQAYEYGYVESSGSGGSWYAIYHSYYYLFKIDFANEDPIADPIIIEHPSSNDYYVGVDRGLMIDDYVYTLSDQIVITYSLVDARILEPHLVF